MLSKLPFGIEKLKRPLITCKREGPVLNAVKKNEILIKTTIIIKLRSISLYFPIHNNPPARNPIRNENKLIVTLLKRISCFPKRI